MRQLSVQDLVEFVQQRRNDAPLLLDVREAWEVAAARLDLPGAHRLHIPMRELPGRLTELDPQRPILGLCHHGLRSLQCVAFLSQRGYPNVYNIAGGIDAWSLEVDASVPRY